MSDRDYNRLKQLNRRVLAIRRKTAAIANNPLPGSSRLPDKCLPILDSALLKLAKMLDGPRSS